MATVLAGSAIGLSLGRVIPGRLHETVRIAIGLFVAVYGIQMALGTRNPLILLVSLVLGAVIGELLRLDEGVQAVGRWTERRAGSGVPFTLAANGPSRHIASTTMPRFGFIALPSSPYRRIIAL